MISDDQWSAVRSILRKANGSSLHASIASANADGSAHVTPIGSLMLGAKGVGMYLDVFNSGLAANVDRDPRVSILVVDSRKVMWLRSLLGGAFVACPGVRLIGSVGPARPTTPAEIDRFGRHIGPLRRTRGARAMWGSLHTARDVTITRAQNLNLGPMTKAAAG